jgi:hypothetical protein
MRFAGLVDAGEIGQQVGEVLVDHAAHQIVFVRKIGFHPRRGAADAVADASRGQPTHMALLRVPPGFR